MELAREATAPAQRRPRRFGAPEPRKDGSGGVSEFRGESDEQRTVKAARVLTFTSLYPSTARPRHGIFVETRLRKLVQDFDVDVRVIAPVPWFPFRAPAFGAYAAYAATPRQESRPDRLEASYPRYAMLPKIGVAWQPDSMALAAQAAVEALGRQGWTPDIIDAHYLYPDGVAAALLARRLGVPFVVTARGSDVNLLAREFVPRRRIRWAADRAAAVIAVSSALKQSLLGLGVPESKLVVLRNGVDADLFRPKDPESADRPDGMPSKRKVAWVGNLVVEKGPDLAIEALALMPELELALVGDGPMRLALVSLARRLGVEARVRFLGTMPQAELREVYSSAEALLLTSTREGWPNVLLEAMACGTPVVACDVGAVREIVTDAKVGRVLARRDPAAIAAALADLLASPPSRQTVRAHALQFGWSAISEGQAALFARVLRTPPWRPRQPAGGSIRDQKS